MNFCYGFPIKLKMTKCGSRVMRRFFGIAINALLAFAFFTNYELVSANVVINEVLPNPIGEDSGAELVELYNNTNTPFSLSGCTLYFHVTDNSQKIDFDSDDFVDKFKVFSSDGEWLNNDGDTLRLVCSNFSDIVPYGNADNSLVKVPGMGETIGRHPDKRLAGILMGRVVFICYPQKQ
jgi:hypothetical protein